MDITKVIKNFHILNSDMIMMEYKKVKSLKNLAIRQMLLNQHFVMHTLI